MKTSTEYLWFETMSRQELINITDKVEAFVDGKILEGFVLVSAMHTSAGVYVNDDDSGLKQDIEKLLEKLVPFGKNYHHHHTGEANGDAHLKCLLVHHEVIIPVTKGRLDLGPWQQVFYAEFDGKRRKRVIMKLMGE